MSAPHSWRGTRKARAMSPLSRRIRMGLATLVAVGLVGVLVWVFWYLFRPPPTHYLFVVQIDYSPATRPEIPLVPFATRDAETLTNLPNARPLSNLQGAQSLDTLKSELGSDIRKQDSLILYIKAHGIAENGTAYVLDADFDPNNAAGPGRIELRDILAMVKEVPAKTKVVILDVCHYVEDVRPGLPLNTFPSLLGKEMENLPDNLWVINSCGLLERSEVSYTVKNSVFTHYVAEALLGDADGFSDKGARGQRDRKIDLAEFYGYVQRKVGQTVQWSHAQAQHPLIFQGGKSEPAQPPAGVFLARVPPAQESPADQAEVAQSGEASDGTPSEKDDAASETAQPAVSATAAADTASSSDAKDAAAEPAVFKLLIEAWRGRDQAEARLNGRPSPIDVAPDQWREAVELLYRYEQLYRYGDESQIPVADLRAAVDVLKSIAQGTALPVAQGSTLTAKLREVHKAMDTSSRFLAGHAPRSFAMARLFGESDDLRRWSDELHRWSKADSPDSLPPGRAESGDGAAPPSSAAPTPAAAAAPSSGQAQDNGAALAGDTTKPKDFKTWAARAYGDHPEIAEIAFAKKIADLLERGEDWELLRLALETRLMAEEAAAFAAWCKPSVEQDVATGDKEFYRGQRELFTGFEGSADRARDAFNNAKKAYAAALNRLREVAQQRNQVNDWWFRSLDFVRWAACAGESPTSKRPPNEQWQELYGQLSAMLKTLGDGASASDSELLKDFDDPLSTEYAKVSPKAGVVGDIEALLSTPLLRSDARAALLRQLFALKPPDDAFDVAVAAYTSAEPSAKIEARADAYEKFRALEPLVADSNDALHEFFAWHAERCRMPLDKGWCPAQADLADLRDARAEYLRLAGNPSSAPGISERLFIVTVSPPEQFLSLSEQEPRSLALKIQPESNEPAKAWIVVDYDDELVELSADSPVSSETDFDSVRDQKPLMLSNNKPLPLTLSLRARSGANQAETTLVVCVIVEGPEWVYQTTRIRLGLPVVDLVVEGEVPNTVAPGEGKGEILLQPFPNHKSRFRMRLENRSHVEKKVTLSIFKLPEPPENEPAWPEDTIRRFGEGARWPSRGPQPISLLEKEYPVPALGQAEWIKLNAAGAQEGANAELPQGQAAQGQEQSGVSIRRGLICFIKPQGEKPRWKWIRIVPLHPEKYVNPEVPRYNPAQRRIVVDVRSNRTAVELPPERIDIELEDVVGVKSKPLATINRTNLQDQLWLEPDGQRQVLFELSVDGYPRAFRYRVDTSRSGSGEPINDARITIKEPKNGGAFKASEDTIRAAFAMDAPRGTFDDGNGYIEIGFYENGKPRPNAKRLFFDRRVEAFLGKVGDDGYFEIDCQIRDLEVNLPNPGIRNEPVRLIARIVSDNPARPLREEYVDVVFDDAPPQIGRPAAGAEEIELGQTVDVSVRASDPSGVKSVEFALDQNRNGMIDDDEKPVKGEPLDDGEWAASLQPATLGSYQLLAKATDAVELPSTASGPVLHVSPKSTDGEKKAGGPMAAFVVTVLRGAEPIVGADVELKIVPEQGEPKRLQKGTTNGRGEFEFRPVGLGSYQIDAKGDHGGRERTGHETRLVTEGAKARIPVQVQIR